MTSYQKFKGILISQFMTPLKNVGNQIVSVPIDFHCIFLTIWKELKLFGYPHFSKYFVSPFVFHRRKSHMFGTT